MPNDDRFNTEREPFSTKTRVKLHTGAAGLGALAGLLPTAYRAIQGQENSAGDTGRDVAIGTGLAALLPLVLNWKRNISGPTGSVKSWDDVYHQLGTVRPRTATYKTAQAAGGDGPYTPSAAEQAFYARYPQLKGTSDSAPAPTVPNPPRRTLWQAAAEDGAALRGVTPQHEYDRATNMVDTYAKGTRDVLTDGAKAGLMFAAYPLYAAQAVGRQYYDAAGNYARASRIGRQLNDPNNTLPQSQRIALEMQQRAHRDAGHVGVFSSPLHALPFFGKAKKYTTPIHAPATRFVMRPGQFGNLLTQAGRKNPLNWLSQHTGARLVPSAFQAARRYVPPKAPAAVSKWRELLSRVTQGSRRALTSKPTAITVARVPPSYYNTRPDIIADGYNDKLREHQQSQK